MSSLPHSAAKQVSGPTASEARRRTKAEAPTPHGGRHEGEPVWVLDQDGSQRAAEYVGEGETSAWFEGPATVIVVYLDTRRSEAVDVERVIPTRLKGPHHPVGRGG